MRTRCSKGASFLGTAAVGLAVSASLCGCGGASPGPGATSSASGRVTLPPGTSLSAVDLTISSSSDDAPVGVDGRFTVAEPPGGGPATVTATDAQGRLVMLGHVDTDNPAFNDVSPTSTAQELLFFSTLSFVLPQDQWPGVYDILAAAPETATLAQVISARIAANPTALADLDAELLAALDAATVSLLPATGAAASIIAPLASSDAPASRSSAVVTETGKAVSVLVKSANPYGLEVLDSLDDLGVFIRNTARIHRFWAVYRTGFVPVTGKSTDPPIALPAWVQVGGGFQSGTTGATGVIGSLIDYFVGKVAWAPKVTPTIPLPMDPPDAKANSFRVFVVGAGAGGLAVPADLAGQPTFATKLADQAKLVVLFEIAKELVWPIVTKAVPAKSIGKLLNDPGQWTTFITQLSYELGTAGLNIDQYVASGDIKDALSAILKAMAGNKLVREAIFKAAQDQLKTLGVNAAGSSVWADSLATVCGAIKVVDIAMTAADTASVFYQIGRSSLYNAWDVTTATPSVAISPKEAFVGAGATQTFAVNVGGGLGAVGQLLYDFSCVQGTLAGVGTQGDVSSEGGRSLISNGSTVLYTAPSNAQSGDTDKVDVEVVFTPSTGPANNDYVVGTDSATVTVGGLYVSGTVVAKIPGTDLGQCSVTLANIDQGLVLGMDGQPNVSPTGSCGAFAFPNPVQKGAAYAVTIVSGPAQFDCVLGDTAVGTINAPVYVTVTCTYQQS